MLVSIVTLLLALIILRRFHIPRGKKLARICACGFVLAIHWVAFYSIVGVLLIFSLDVRYRLGIALGLLCSFAYAVFALLHIRTSIVSFTVFSAYPRARRLSAKAWMSSSRIRADAAANFGRM